jgi:hypothetical protein
VKKLLIVILVGLQTFCFGQSEADKYVAQYNELASMLIKQHKIPVSVILGIAIHESASGNSKIAKHLNNHFGIKGSNNNKQINSSYKGYDSVEDSYNDFINMMKSRSKFKILFDKYSDYDYKNWIYGIQKGGYAASRVWAAQVISIIQKHKLYECDNRPANFVEPTLDDARYVSVSSLSNYYKVKKGDTLGAIAKKFNTTSKNLLNKNALKSTLLQIGQKLKIK